MNNLPLSAEEFEYRHARTKARWEHIPKKFRFFNQTLGRTQAIGCVALEITQRCNLDCTLCYLSENSQSVPDLPMAELKRRVDVIRQEFCAGTNVQVTGGDPTMRPQEELLEVVRYIRARKMSPVLFTNGIKATRKLLRKLKEAGLTEVAFHVDTTQERPGYTKEVELNQVREQYIERVRGLDLAVYFNTTVHQGNFHEIPELVRFFVSYSDVVSIGSFQIQADIGRGIWHQRAKLITLDTVHRQIEKGLGRQMTWDALKMGHPECHRQTYALVVGGKIVDCLDSPELIRLWLKDFGDFPLYRSRQWRNAWRILSRVIRRQQWLLPAGCFLIRKVKAHGRDWIRGGFRAHNIMFFIENFQDRNRLEPERLELCSFQVMTQNGPISMCLHNAHRNEYILPENQPGVYPEGGLISKTSLRKGLFEILT